jgi:hypothetical protein
MRAFPRRFCIIIAALMLGHGAALLALWVLSKPQVTGVPAMVSADGGVGSEGQYSPLADELLAARYDAAHDIVTLGAIINQFNTLLRLNERPPLGDNRDISAALTGANRRRVVFIPPTHPALRGGLLVDRWGTPLQFHARSADAIDVRSAGPDRVLYTADDLTNEPSGRGF